MNNINIKDIARLAGVGIGTVSRVINNHPDVKEETRAHILKIIEDHGYIPNATAQYLKRTETKDIGILIKGIHNPLFSKMLEIIEASLAECGYSVILHHQLDANVRDIDIVRSFTKEKRLKGIICLGGDFDDISTKEIESLRIPIIFTIALDNPRLDANAYSSVSIDNEKASLKAVSHLARIGHSKIGLLTTGEGDQTVGRRRTNGYLRALAEFGIEKVEERFEVGDYTFDSAYDATKRLLNKSPDISALFAISDIMAIGAAKAILEAGYKIPEDIAIVGFDDIDYARYFNPPLTTIRQPIDEMATEICNIMRNIIENNAVNNHILFETQLVVREST